MSPLKHWQLNRSQQGGITRQKGEREEMTLLDELS